MIVDIGHVALCVPDLDEAVEFATGTLGMYEVERVDRTSYLTLASPYPSLGAICPHHVLEYTEAPEAALDHVGLIAEDEKVLDELTQRAVARGASLLQSPEPDQSIEPSVRFAAPSGHVFEVYVRMARVEASYGAIGVRPHRLGHVNLWSRNAPDFVRFCVETFGFRVSDWIGDPAGDGACFMRCHQEHHTVAVNAGPLEGIYHYAFEMGNVADIGRLADLLARRGERFIWGPGRHGAGDNIAAYFEGPGGTTVEAYADMQKIADPAWEPRVWGHDTLPAAANLWGPMGGTERMTHTGLAEIKTDR